MMLTRSIMVICKLQLPWKFRDVFLIDIKDFPIKPIPGSIKDLTTKKMVKQLTLRKYKISPESSQIV